MFDIGAVELLVIAIVAIIAVGPKDLPRMLRTLGKWVAQARSMAREFQTQFEQAADEAGMQDFRKGLESVREATPAKDLREAVNPLSDAGDSLKRSITSPAGSKGGGSTDPNTSAAAESAAQEASGPAQGTAAGHGAGSKAEASSRKAGSGKEKKTPAKAPAARKAKARPKPTGRNRSSASGGAR